MYCMSRMEKGELRRGRRRTVRAYPFDLSVAPSLQSHPPEQSHEALARRLQEAEEEIRRVQGLADDQQQRIETLEEERDDQQQRIKTLEEESKLQDQRINRLQQWIESTLGVPGPTSGS